MPYRSKAQQGFLHAQHPEIAARWDRHTSKKQFRKLPQRKVTKSFVPGVGYKAARTLTAAERKLVRNGGKARIQAKQDNAESNQGVRDSIDIMRVLPGKRKIGTLDNVPVTSLSEDGIDHGLAGMAMPNADKTVTVSIAPREITDLAAMAHGMPGRAYRKEVIAHEGQHAADFLLNPNYVNRAMYAYTHSPTRGAAMGAGSEGRAVGSTARRKGMTAGHGGTYSAAFTRSNLRAAGQSPEAATRINRAYRRGQQHPYALSRKPGAGSMTTRQYKRATDGKFSKSERHVMPHQSTSQQGFLHAQKPGIAASFDRHTTKSQFGRLPEKSTEARYVSKVITKVDDHPQSTDHHASARHHQGQLDRLHSFRPRGARSHWTDNLIAHHRKHLDEHQRAIASGEDKRTSDKVVKVSSGANFGEKITVPEQRSRKRIKQLDELHTFRTRHDPKTRTVGKADVFKRQPRTPGQRAQHYGTMAATTGTLSGLAGGLAAGSAATGIAESKGKDPMGFARSAKTGNPLSGAARAKVLKPITQAHMYQAKTLGTAGLAAGGLSAAYHLKRKRELRMAGSPLAKAQAIPGVNPRKRNNLDRATDVGLGAATAATGFSAMNEAGRQGVFLRRHAGGELQAARGAHAAIRAHQLGHFTLPAKELKTAKATRSIGLRVAGVKGVAAGAAAGAAAAGGASLYQLGRNRVKRNPGIVKRGNDGVDKRLPGETKSQAVTRHQRQVGGLFTTAAAVPALMGVRSGIAGARMARGAEKTEMAASQLKHGATAIGLGALGSGIAAAPVPKRLFGINPKRNRKPKVPPTGISHRGLGKPASSGYHNSGVGKADQTDQETWGQADKGVDMSVDAFGVDRSDLIGKALNPVSQRQRKAAVGGAGIGGSLGAGIGALATRRPGGAALGATTGGALGSIGASTASGLHSIVRAKKARPPGSPLIKADTRGKGSHAARQANAIAFRQGVNPRQSSAAQAVLGRKGARVAMNKSVPPVVSPLPAYEAQRTIDGHDSIGFSDPGMAEFGTNEVAESAIYRAVGSRYAQ